MAIATGSILTLPDTGAPYALPAVVSYGLTPEQMQANNAKQKEWLDKFKQERDTALPPINSADYPAGAADPNNVPAWSLSDYANVAGSLLNAFRTLIPGGASNPVPVAGAASAAVTTNQIINDPATWQKFALIGGAFVLMGSLIVYGTFSLGSTANAKT